jgi:hypothetical protein
LESNSIVVVGFLKFLKLLCHVLVDVILKVHLFLSNANFTRCSLFWALALLCVDEF